MKASEKVMNNDDLKKLIISYLRKKPQLSCDNCQTCLIWDRKVTKYYEVPILTDIWYFSTCYTLCQKCFHLPLCELSKKLKL